ncbi:hypothetical protein BGX38DRAFT_1164920 [Terfezia claveryi]|nr:hypothetical protein BGX38DRAFT_1164920 [Terfezia claveryi]
MPALASCSRSILRLCRNPAVQGTHWRSIEQAPAVLLARPFASSFSQRDIKKPSSIPTAAGLRATTNFPSEGGNDPREVFSELDVLSDLPIPASAVDSVFDDGFLLNNGQEIHGMVDEVTRELKDVTAKARRTGVLELNDEPDLLIIGTGHRTLLLHSNSRKRIQGMGINLDVMDTQHAAAQYNLLATERPGTQVAAALMMAGFGR